MFLKYFYFIFKKNTSTTTFSSKEVKIIENKVWRPENVAIRWLLPFSIGPALQQTKTAWETKKNLSQLTNSQKLTKYTKKLLQKWFQTILRHHFSSIYRVDFWWISSETLKYWKMLTLLCFARDIFFFLFAGIVAAIKRFQFGCCAF